MVAQFMGKRESLPGMRLTLVNPDDGACVEFENEAVYVALEVPCEYLDAAILYQVLDGNRRRGNASGFEQRFSSVAGRRRGDPPPDGRLREILSVQSKLF